jgi:hypothetical protein
MKDYPQQHHPLVQIHHLRWIIHPLVLFHWDSMLNPGGHYETLSGQALRAILKTIM